MRPAGVWSELLLELDGVLLELDKLLLGGDELLEELDGLLVTDGGGDWAVLHPHGAEPQQQGGYGG